MSKYICQNNFNGSSSVNEIKNLISTTSSHRHSAKEVHLPHTENIDGEIGGERKQNPLRFSRDRRKTIEGYGFN